MHVICQKKYEYHNSISTSRVLRTNETCINYKQNNKQAATGQELKKKLLSFYK